MLNILLLLIVVTFVICLYQVVTKRNKLDEFSDLYNNGYVVKHNIISKDILNKIKDYWDRSEFKQINDIIKGDEEIQKFIKQNIKLSGYKFMDYIMFLENSVLHTCHRDNNSNHFNNIKPSYTMILYIDDMDNCLDVIPNSHKDRLGMYLYDKTNTFMCKGGSIILFDASLVHSGSVDSKEKNRRIQLKISHIDDLEKLSFYQNYNKILDKRNKNSDISKKIQKHFSCRFPIMSDITQGKDKDYIKGDISWSTGIFSKLFYSDNNYYKLKTAF